MIIVKQSSSSFQQMQKIHIDDFYRKVVPDGTPDCEPDPGFNYDKARKKT